MCEELRLQRYDNSPWGFRLTGGLDFGTPLSIIKVTGGSIAEEAGVQAGDLLKSINGKPTTHFTHLDAQKCIATSGNFLTITVLRGSVVTPSVTPLRGLSPAISYKSSEDAYARDSPKIMKTDVENEIMNYYHREREMGDGPRSPAAVQVKSAGQRATITSDKHQYRLDDEGQLFLGDRALTDLEIAELITSNEEVLDEGVLGINFKKFLPKVDFIRNSEVFKMLQSENTKKELSEQAQLQRDPNKRFSTFLMKPRGRYDHQPDWTFVKFKPPRYLPKPPEKKWELPKLKPWERPKKKEPEHSVLWLFLEEKGEEIIDERWGTEEEERLNASRNSYIEFDRSSQCSSSLRMTAEDDTSSLASRDLERRPYESSTHEKHSADLEEFSDGDQVIKKPKVSFESKITEEEEQGRKKPQIVFTSEVYQQEEEQFEEAAETSIKKEEETYREEVDKRASSGRVEEKLVEQLADIQCQIQALESEAPSGLRDQLLAVKEQLSRILQIKTSAQETVTSSTQVKQRFEDNSLERSFKDAHEERASSKIHQEEVRKSQLSQIEQSFEEHKSYEERYTSAEKEEFSVQNETVNGHVEDGSVSEIFVVQSHAAGGQMRSAVSQEKFVTKEEALSRVEHKSEKKIEVSTYQVEELEESEFKLCITPSPKVQEINEKGEETPLKEVTCVREKPKKKKPRAQPITPQTRPIVLPGGRLWRQPKDAEHEEFYQGILVAQAEVLIGTNESLNYTKYMPPKVDMTTSEVYRLIHETEGGDQPPKEEEKDYCPPISKRHFYAATLREPPPIGVVELSDL